MDKPADSPQFLLHLPVWLIMHPRKKSKGYLMMAGQTGHVVMPLFSEERLAQRYRDGAPQLREYVLSRAGDSGEMTQVLNSMEGQGFTHAAIDPTTKRGVFFAIDQLRAFAKQLTQHSPARHSAP